MNNSYMEDYLSRLMRTRRGARDAQRRDMWSTRAIASFVMGVRTAIEHGYMSANDITDDIIELQLITEDGIVGIPVIKKQEDERSVYIEKNGRITESSEDAVYQTGEQKLVMIETDIYDIYDLMEVSNVLDTIASYLHKYDRS